MSAGPGRTQAAILAALAERGGRWRASRLPGGRNRARALAALERRGLVRRVVGEDGIERAELRGVFVSEAESALQQSTSDADRASDGYAPSMRDVMTLRVDSTTKTKADEVAARLGRRGLHVARATVLRAALERGLAVLAAETERAGLAPVAPSAEGAGA